MYSHLHTSLLDAWTQDGILEYYWGEHIHLGYYSDEDLAKGFRSWRKKDFKQAKFDFTDKMMAFGGFGTTTNYGEGKELKVLDVGCGVGGGEGSLKFLDTSDGGCHLFVFFEENIQHTSPST